MPRAAEAAEAARMRAAAATVQRWWRRRRWQLAVEERHRSRGCASSQGAQQWGCASCFRASLHAANILSFRSVCCKLLFHHSYVHRSEESIWQLLIGSVCHGGYPVLHFSG